MKCPHCGARNCNYCDAEYARRAVPLLVDDPTPDQLAAERGEQERRARLKAETDALIRDLGPPRPGESYAEFHRRYAAAKERLQ